MKHNIISTLIVSMVLLLMGCSSDIPREPEATGESGSILSIDIAMEEMSRGPITSTTFQDGDSVFVIVRELEGYSSLIIPTKAKYKNGWWNLVETIDLSQLRMYSVEVEVYYPYEIAADGYDIETGKIKLTDIISHQDDILYGTGYATRDWPTARVTCKHALTRLTFALKNNSNEKVYVDGISFENQGALSFLVNEGVLDVDGVSPGGGKINSCYFTHEFEINEGETYNLEVLIPPTTDIYDNMMAMGGRTLLLFEVYLGGGPVRFGIDAAPWAAGHQYTYPVNLFSTTEPDPEVPETEYVDLGLPSGTKWCTHNVGASSPEEIGGYYAWGETDPNNSFGIEFYKYYNVSYGFEDIGKNISGTQYDVAYVQMGRPWRMPTSEQIIELSQYCTSQQTTVNNVNGYLMTGPNGKQIFFPAGGYRYYSFKYEENTGMYRSGTYFYDIEADNVLERPCAYDLTLSSGNQFSQSFHPVIYGLPVRAVFK